MSAQCTHTHTRTHARTPPNGALCLQQPRLLILRCMPATICYAHLVNGIHFIRSNMLVTFSIGSLRSFVSVRPGMSAHFIIPYNGMAVWRLNLAIASKIYLVMAGAHFICATANDSLTIFTSEVGHHNVSHAGRVKRGGVESRTCSRFRHLSRMAVAWAT